MCFLIAVMNNKKQLHYVWLLWNCKLRGGTKDRQWKGKVKFMPASYFVAFYSTKE